MIQSAQLFGHYLSSNMFYADIDSISNCFMLMRIILVSIKRGSLSHLYTAA